MIIAITGSTGLVGTALAAALEGEGHLVRPVVRDGRGSASRDAIHWEPAVGKIDAAEFASVDAVVHLAGENVAGGRWTPAVKQRIVDSRVQGTTLLCKTLAGLATKPSTLVCASAIGIYGNRGDAQLDESSAPGTGFLADLCQKWEACSQPARDVGIRVVDMRIGIVLSKAGGALSKMLTPFKLGLGGVIGSGQQYMSWITLDDLVRAIQFALTSSTLVGSANATAPNPATNRELTKTLGYVLHRPTIFPMPAFAARLAFGEMADELLLGGARVFPRALEGAGFQFEYPTLVPALKHVLAL